MRIAMLIVLLVVKGSVMAQTRLVDHLDRGLVALERSGDVYLSWRLLGTESMETAYHIYRDGTKITTNPVSTSTNFVDAGGSAASVYTVAPVNNGVEGEKSAETSVWALQPGDGSYASKPKFPFRRIPLPTAPHDEDSPETTYIPGDMNVGDLDGDGDYELVFEWEPEGGLDTRRRYLEAIDLEGNSFWRIDAGPNTDKLAHIVYDLDMDGKAEVAFKSGPGAKDGTGTYLSKGPAATDDDSRVYARSSGRLVEDPAYLTVVDGLTGTEQSTVNYWPNIGPGKGRDWGDNYGHRASSIKACVIWVKGTGPVLVYFRGIYTRIALSGYQFDGEELNVLWRTDTKDNPELKPYEGQGNHSLSVGDIDGDGSDEIVYGACAFDHDGSGLYTTGFGHGDADHLGDHDPDRPGLEFFQPHEDAVHGISFRDAGTGEIIWEYGSPGDIGRGWAADVIPDYPGSEMSTFKLEEDAPKFTNYGRTGARLATEFSPYYQPMYWDGDLQRELREGNTLDNPTIGGAGRILTFYHYGASTIHSSKNDANMVMDLVGDWREEVIFRHHNNQELLVFSTNIPTEHKAYTLMHDPLYRMNIVRQNIGYNQPAHTGYFFANGSPQPDITTINSCELAFAPSVKVDNGEWQSSTTITITEGSSVSLKGEIADAGTWEWSGCEVSGTTGEVTFTPTGTCTVFGAFKASNGCQAIEVFKVIVNSTLVLEENEDGFCYVDGEVNETRGVANTDDAENFEIKWAVVVPYAAQYELSWNYSSIENILSKVTINGNVAVENMAFPATSGDAFAKTSTVKLELSDGLNVIRLVSKTDAGLADIDFMEIFGHDPQPRACVGTGKRYVLNNWYQNKNNVYPNPIDAGDEVFITGDSPIRKITFLNLNGQVVKTLAGRGELSMDLKLDVSAGLYTINVLTDSGIQSTKLLIQ